MVDVDDFSMPLAGEIAAENLHVARQDHQVDIKAPQQCHYLGLLVNLGFGCDRQVIEWNAELVCNNFQVRVITDDQGDVALQVAFILAGDQVVETVAGFANHDGHPRVVITVVALPRQVVLLGEETKVLFKLLKVE